MSVTLAEERSTASVDGADAASLPYELDGLAPRCALERLSHPEHCERVAPGGASFAAPGAVRAIAPPEAIDILDDDEIIILLIQPSPWYIPLSCLGSLAAIAFITLLMAWSSRFPVAPWTDAVAFGLGAILTIGRLAWQAIDWSQRLYVLTDRRLVRRSGVFRPDSESIPLRDIRHTVVLAAPRERLLGLGTIMFATAFGISGHSWDAVRRPHEVSAVVREAVDRYG